MKKLADDIFGTRKVASGRTKEPANKKVTTSAPRKQDSVRAKQRRLEVCSSIYE